QHISYERQLDIKVDYVKKQFEENAPDVMLPDIALISSITPYRYRNSITLHGPGEPGFWQVMGIDMLRNEECPVTVPGVEKELQRLRQSGFKEFLDQGIDNVMIRAGNQGEVYAGVENTK